VSRALTRARLETGEPRWSARSRRRVIYVAAALFAFYCGWRSATTIAPRLARGTGAPILEIAGLDELAAPRLERRLRGALAAGLGPATIREQLLRDPWIADVRVSTALPGRLLVRVVEREPAAVLVVGRDRWIVDRAGVPLERVAHGAASSLPRLVAPRESEAGTRDPAVVSGLGSLALLEAAGLRVSEWRLAGKPARAYPQALLDGLDVPVIFGAGDRVEQLERLAQVIGLTEVREAGAIDLRFGGQVVLVPGVPGGGRHVSQR